MATANARKINKKTFYDNINFLSFSMSFYWLIKWSHQKEGHFLKQHMKGVRSLPTLTPVLLALVIALIVGSGEDNTATR